MWRSHFRGLPPCTPGRERTTRWLRHSPWCYAPALRCTLMRKNPLCLSVYSGALRDLTAARGPPRPCVEDCAGAFQSPHGSAALVETSAASLLQQFVVVISWTVCADSAPLRRLGSPGGSPPASAVCLLLCWPARSCSVCTAGVYTHTHTLSLSLSLLPLSQKAGTRVPTSACERALLVSGLRKSYSMRQMLENRAPPSV